MHKCSSTQFICSCLQRAVRCMSLQSCLSHNTALCRAALLVRVYARCNVAKRQLLTLLGVMVSVIDIVPWARLRLRPIQLYLLALWKPSRNRLSHSVPIRPVLRFHLMWWMDRNILVKGTALRTHYTGNITSIGLHFRRCFYPSCSSKTL